MMYIDGVFHENYQGEEVFREFIPSHEEVVNVTAELKKCLTRLLLKMDSINPDDFSLNHLQAQSVQNRDEKNQTPTQLEKVCDPPFKEFKGTL